MQQREKSQGNQNIVKYRQDGGSPVNPLESEGNIYQHARQSIEGNENCLAAELGTYLRSHNLDVADREGAQSVVALQGRNHGGCNSTHRGQVIEIREHTTLCGVAVG